MLLIYIEWRYKGSNTGKRARMLDTSAPGQIGTRTLRHLCETFRYQDKSAPGQFGTPIRQIGTSKRQIGTCVFLK